MTRKKLKKLLLSLAALILILAMAGIVSAHYPVIVGGGSNTAVEVKEPEISKAYYGAVYGNHIYKIESDKNFTLYANLLMPDDSKGKFQQECGNILNFTIYKDAELIANPSLPFWNSYYEKYGKDYYFKGPEISMNATPGTYYIVVSSHYNNTRYTLAIGTEEDIRWYDWPLILAKVLYLKLRFFN